MCRLLARLASFEATNPNKEMCSQHPEEKLRLYCHFCKTVVCVVCLDTMHVKHHCSNVETASKKLRKLIDNGVNRVSNRIARHNQQRKELQDEYKRFLDSADQIEETTKYSEKRMKVILEDSLKSVLQELNGLKVKTQTEVDNATQQLDKQLNEMGKFKVEAEECRDNGSSLEVARNGPRLATLAEKLDQLKVRALVHKLHFLPSVPKAECTGKGRLNVTIGKFSVSSGLSGFNTFPLMCCNCYAFRITIICCMIQIIFF